ncbi:hypothetical protein CMUS01_02899 [Colletotrichum musicola]|uniref:Uncharacterized protein n=1 Tax=Colletotrichum musicola TaxID=2175873 RepID=A0A8H6NU76_9PEZI|nr:hypothetical protein CMUS01_02899 [Colletotrichum musicola]
MFKVSAEKAIAEGSTTRCLKQYLAKQKIPGRRWRRERDDTPEPLPSAPDWNCMLCRGKIGQHFAPNRDLVRPLRQIQEWNFYENFESRPGFAPAPGFCHVHIASATHSRRKARELQGKACEMLERLRPGSPRESCITRCLNPHHNHHNHPYNTATHRNPSVTLTVDDWVPPLTGSLYVTNPDPKPTMVSASAAEPIDVHDLEVDREPPRQRLFVTNPDAEPPSVPASETPSVPVTEAEYIYVDNLEAEEPQVTVRPRSMVQGPPRCLNLILGLNLNPVLDPNLSLCLKLGLGLSLHVGLDFNLDLSVNLSLKPILQTTRPFLHEGTPINHCLHLVLGMSMLLLLTFPQTSQITGQFSENVAGSVLESRMPPGVGV